MKKVATLTAVICLFVFSPGGRTLESREGFLETPAGKVWYRVVGNSGGTPLLILHGGPGARGCWLSGLSALAQGRAVVFYDQLGSGRSDRPDDESLWQIERFVTELAMVRRALGLDRVHLLGHSWGSTLAAEYVLTHQPDGVESVIFVGPLLSTPRWIADANRLRQTLPDYVQRVLQRNEQAGTTGSDEYKTAAEVFYDRYYQRKPHELPADCEGSVFNEELYMKMWGPSEFYATGTLKGYDRTDKLAELKMPVLFLIGRYDEATPETVADFHRLIPGSELVILENSAHMSMLDEPEQFMSAVTSFLNRVEARGGGTPPNQLAPAAVGPPDRRR